MTFVTLKHISVIKKLPAASEPVDSKYVQFSEDVLPQPIATESRKLYNCQDC